MLESFRKELRDSSLPLMVLGLAVMGFAELFIDPVAMSQITRIEIPGVTGVLTGIYMLLSGAIANYLAGVIADQTSQASFDASGAINYSINAYIEVFDQIPGRGRRYPSHRYGKRGKGKDRSCQAQ